MAKYTELTKKELLVLRDEKIRNDFLHQTKAKHLDATYVVHEVLQHKYFLEVSSLWLIVRGTYKRLYHTGK